MKPKTPNQQKLSTANLIYSICSHHSCSTNHVCHCPLYGAPNNEEMKVDAKKALSLIYAYNRTLSDASNEIEQYCVNDMEHEMILGISKV